MNPATEKISIEMLEKDLKADKSHQFDYAVICRYTNTSLQGRIFPK
jgi:hypothetical protein